MSVVIATGIDTIGRIIFHTIIIDRSAATNIRGGRTACSLLESLASEIKIITENNGIVSAMRARHDAHIPWTALLNAPGNSVMQ